MKRWLILGIAVLAAACGEEDPVSVGAGLLPADAIRTFEVVLDAEDYLVFDTAFGVYSATSDADFSILANAYRGALHSRVLVQYTIPRSISVLDAGGVLRTDTLPVFFEGGIQLVVDTLSSSPAAVVEVYRATEPWDRLTATWELRVDSFGVQVPWTVPGGSPGARVGTAAYEAGADTVTVPIDSATIAAWADTTNAGRGAVIGLGTTDTRLRTTPPSLRVRARSTLRPDTIVEVALTPARTFIYTPDPGETAGGVRVGGVPNWRGILRLRDDLAQVLVPCPGAPDCRVRLGRATINYAGLRLRPVPAPPGFEPERPVAIAAHLLLPSARVPLQRSPVTEAVALLGAPIPGSQFLAPDAPVVELPLTSVLQLALRPADSTQVATNASHIALLQAGTTRTFGIATFAEAPQLRLILTIAKELQLQ